MKTEIDASNQTLGSIVDPIHGPINLEDQITSSTAIIRSLINTPTFVRLRGIKQLGFASYYFPGADHTRLAHALGTMQVLRRLVAKQINHLGSKTFGQSIKLAFPKHFARYANGSALDGAISTHVYIAGLLQDIGELPFGKVTEVYFRPIPEEKLALARELGQQGVLTLGTKDFFTLACVKREIDNDRILSEHISFRFLAYLITGVWAPEQTSSPRQAPATVRHFAHMLDGVVDADRIDYVSRDGLHTTPASGLLPSTVLEHLLYYSDDGPVFSESEPVVAFLTAYAQLWSSFYFAAGNRFRLNALGTVFNEIKHSEIGKLARDDMEALASQLHRGLSVDEFLLFDDRKILNEVQLIATRQSVRDNRRLYSALSVLLDNNKYRPYDALWVSPRKTMATNRRVDFRKWQDGAIFFDAFFQGGWRILYSKRNRPIFVRSKFSATRQRELPLDKIDGPFKTLFSKNEWRFTRKRGSVLVFFPSSTEVKKEVLAEANNAGFYWTVSQQDPLTGGGYSDTREFAKHNKPAVFVSYESGDLDCVHLVSAALYRMRRQYYFLRTSACVGGISPEDQSIAFANDATVALILLSQAYMEKYAMGVRQREGNIWSEVNTLLRRISDNENIRVRFLTPDGFRFVREFRKFGFPLFELVGQKDRTRTTQIPAMAKSIRSMTADELVSALGEVLENPADSESES